MAKDKDAAVEAKTKLGEAGPVWWQDDTTDYSSLPPMESPYAEWWRSLSESERLSGM